MTLKVDFEPKNQSTVLFKNKLKKDFSLFLPKLIRLVAVASILGMSQLQSVEAQQSSFSTKPIAAETIGLVVSPTEIQSTQFQKTEKLTPEEIFANLAETQEQVSTNLREVGGYVLVKDMNDEVIEILASAQHWPMVDSNKHEYTIASATRQTDGSFSSFKPLYNFPNDFESGSILKRSDNSISVAGWNPRLGTIKYFTSTDGGNNFVEENYPPDLIGGDLCKEQEQFGDITLINTQGGNFDGSIVIRYSDATMKRVTWQTSISRATDSMNAKRNGNEIIAYFNSIYGGMLKVVIPDLYHPQAQRNNLNFDTDSIEIKWGPADAERFYLSISGLYFYVTDAAGNIISEETFDSEWQVDDMFSIRLFGEDKLLVGSQWNNVPMLVWRDLTKPIADPTATTRMTFAEWVNDGIIYKSNMQIGKIDGDTYAFINIFGTGLIVVKVDPDTMSFGAPIWITKGLGEKKEAPPTSQYKIFLPLAIK